MKRWSFAPSPWELYIKERLLVDPVFPAVTVLSVYFTSALISSGKAEAKRLEAFALSAPAPDWDGTFTATSK